VRIVCPTYKYASSLRFALYRVRSKHERGQEVTISMKQDEHGQFVISLRLRPQIELML
jgi:hypothetical protein